MRKNSKLANQSRLWRNITKAVITDAGFASRFLPWTKTNPKAMLPLGNMPIMQHVINECVEAGISEIIIVTTKEGKVIYDDYFENAVNHVRKQLRDSGKLQRYESVQEVLDFPKIRVIIQDPALPYGNGSPIYTAKQYIGDDEPFVVCYSDDLLLNTSDVKTMIETFHRYSEVDAIIMGQEIPDSQVDKYGMIKLLDDQSPAMLDCIVEKPSIGNQPSNLASYGRYLLTPRIFDYLKPNKTGKDGELWTVDAITELAKFGQVMVATTKGKWVTTGDPANYAIAQINYILEHEDYADEVFKAVVTHSSARQRSARLTEADFS